MSSSDRAAIVVRRIARLAGALAVLAAVAGCTVQPLYGDRTSAISGKGVTTSQRLAQVEIKPVSDRVGQETRNHMIFLFGGGQGQPANPAYHLTLTVRAINSRAATIETRERSLSPTSGIVMVRGNYRLTDAATGAVISAGTRTVQAPYDIPAQQFAALRAVRNAEDRGARELAELLRLVVAQELERATSVTEPRVLSAPEEMDDPFRQEDPIGL